MSSRTPAANAELHDILAGFADLIAKRVAATLDARPHPIPGSVKQPEPDFLDERDAARRSSISVRTLQGWRGKGRGPRFVRAHRKVLYPRREFEEWLRSQ